MKKTYATIVLFIAVLLPSCLCVGSTITALSSSYTDVSDACGSASPGDTVLMPPGTNVWLQTLWLPGGVSLIGSGTNQTTIICGDDGGSGNICAIACNALSSNNITRISSFTLQGTNSINYNDWGCIWMNIGDGPAFYDGNAVPWRIDHIIFNGIPMDNIKVNNVHSGLIDHCVFNVTQPSPWEIIRLVASDSDGSGSYSWSIPYIYGGTNALYVENCFFTNSLGYNFGLCDADGGGSMVFRYNTIYGCSYNNHGTEGTSVRAQRSFEIYNNTFIANSGDDSNSPAMLIRGGTGIIYSNTVIGWKYVEQTFVKRVMQWCTTVDGANGTCPWDSNDPTIYLSGVWSGGTASANNNYTWLSSDITFTNIIPWATNQWVGYTVWNTNAPYYFSLDNNAPVYWFGTIVANTTNTLSVINPKNSYADQGPQTPLLTFNNGDGYQFRRVIRTLDQIGLGSGDYVSLSNNGWTVDTNIDGAYILPLAGEVDEPLYWWSNTLDGAASYFDNSGFAIIQYGRDYFNGIPKPGYVPLVYPHPLDTDSSDGISTNLLGWWRFTEGSGSTTADYSGSGHTGVLQNSPTWSTGPTGVGAITLNGSSSQYVLVSGSGSILAGLPAWTISLWVNTTEDNWASGVPFYAESKNSGDDLFEFCGVYNSCSFYYTSDDGIGGGLNGSATVNDGNWHHVCATFTGSTFTTYVDGILDSTAAWSSSSTLTGEVSAAIGAYTWTSSYSYASFSDVRLYNTALTSTQVSNLYSSGAQ